MSHHAAGFKNRLFSRAIPLGLMLACGGSDLAAPEPGTPAAITIVRGNEQSGAPGTALTDPVMVKVVDSQGDPLPGQVVAFTPRAAGSEVTPQTSSTGADGTAGARWILGSTSGTQELVAEVVTDGAPNGLEVRFTASATASSLVLRTQPSSSATGGVPFDRQPAVEIHDFAGKLVKTSGVAVTATLPANRGSLGGTKTRLTDADGKAEFTDLSINGTTGSEVLIFAADGYTSVTSDPVEVRSATRDQAPVTVDDEYYTLEGFEHTLRVGPAGGVLQNDRDPEGGDLTASDPSHPPQGTVTLAADGSFSYTPEGGYFGDDTFTYRATDPAGNSSIATVTIHIAPINDAPRFTAGDPPAVGRNAGPQTVPAWATGISPGAYNETGEVLEFLVTGNSNPGLFTAGGQPKVTREGPQSKRATLTYTPSGRTGSASITVVLKDNGGTANGGDDTSIPFTFTIRIR